MHDLDESPTNNPRLIYMNTVYYNKRAYNRGRYVINIYLVNPTVYKNPIHLTYCCIETPRGDNDQG